MKLLVIEDDVRMAGLLRRGLAQEGWSVDVVGAAADARHAVASTPYDVVVCDVGLPGPESGLDWCRWFRSAGHWTPVLLLTARTEVSDRISGLDSGADDYLGKPFAFGELAARLRALLRRGETERPTQLANGELVLDPAEHRVRWRQQMIDLSPREFALLDYFLRRPGDVLRRTDVLDHVWDYAYDGTSNVVDVHVMSLRRRLEQAGCPDVIETVRGVGYRLRVLP
ncbi:response regulator transcription factor [Pedococcus bigeumensis]|uniref:DNA-binding response regulator n=1 Tax=Pedococcus bigeumensis TaxID=433644 RepID=A0A502CXT9_9MICO|nr:response regulator transcription factor [Pedococcus bigeumensis]TPG17350.1 DNA-binding response regulator [Pedococcus bigeumensis]